MKHGGLLFFLLLLVLPGCSSETSNDDDSSNDDDAADDDDSGAPHSPGDLNCHDEFDDRAGTQAHEHDLVEWRSEDGTDWTEHRLFQACADVPSLARDGSGTVLMAYQNFQDRDNQDRFDRVLLRRSIDQGESWELPTVPTLVDFPAGAARPFDPTIVWDPEGGLWRLYFSMSTSGSRTLDENVCTHSAVSTDGLNFTYEQGPRFCASGGAVIDPAVALFGESWIYMAPRGAPQDGSHLATSEDGLTFVDGVPISSDNNHAWTGNLAPVGDELRFYGREVLHPNENYLWWSSSSDGLSWSDYTQTNIPAGKDPGILRRADGSFLIIVPTAPPK
jgi:hypothetical protein